MIDFIEESWFKFFENEFNKLYFKKMEIFLENEYKTSQIFPPQNLIFNAFNQCSIDKLKIVILGQDPYHDDGQAHGLCFSVPQGIKKPPSLRNIFKELKDDLNIEKTSTDLTSWAQQGILLLNTALTVEAHKPMSHSHIGWSIFTNNVIQLISSKKDIIFLLWGNHAQKKQQYIADGNHILTANHPSPLSASRGFFGCKHFSKTNELLKEMGKELIDWR